MKKIVSLSLLVFSLLLAGCAQQPTVSTPPGPPPATNTDPEVSQTVKKLCAKKTADQCGGNCLDGFNEYCYYDSTKYSENQIQGLHSFSDETKKACFGLHTLSVCGDCINKFELRKTGQLIEVTCEELFQAIENYNKTCDDCLNEGWAGCC